ncbi:MAG TPA: hypothetical protein VM328_04510, partial [Fimbriimonadaceae bacterium]|nr:hypothetical protein [Fimbriimonadaceae bacterium]
SMFWPAPAGRLVSVLPLTPAQGVNLRGVRWPLADAALHPQGLISLSNQVEGREFEVSVGEGSLFVFLELPEAEQPWWGP